MNGRTISQRAKRGLYIGGQPPFGMRAGGELVRRGARGVAVGRDPHVGRGEVGHGDQAVPVDVDGARYAMPYREVVSLLHRGEGPHLSSFSMIGQVRLEDGKAVTSASL